MISLFKSGFKKKLHQIVNAWWYSASPWHKVLYPLTLIYMGIIRLRRYILTHYYQQQWAVPIIVVGNITVGGAGKTPLVIALATKLTARGYRVGIISRGYKSNLPTEVYEVTPSDTAGTVGDEPFLLFKKARCPVILSSRRVKAVQYLLSHHDVQIIISDDGLQHYAMGRAIEIAVLDGVRGVGNGLCLPFGPLREPASRLQQVDLLVVNGFSQEGGGYLMNLEPGTLTRLRDGKATTVADLSMPVAAVAGIGYPQRFFNTLKSLNITFQPYSFPDHYAFRAGDFNFPEKTVVMTEKDAVKCLAFATNEMYSLPVEALLPEAFWETLFSNVQLSSLPQNKKLSSH